MPGSTDLPIVFAGAGVVLDGLNALKRVSLSIAAGPPTVVVGPNGSGKTTLLKAAMGLVAATTGSVTWGGRSAPAALHRAIVFQRPVMLRRSVSANINYALARAQVARAERAERCRELLSLVGLADLSARPARSLSTGEQQRIAMARALARDPAVLFLDEPTASLDPAATKAIEDIVIAVSARGVKVVLATHDLGQARRLGGEVVLLHKGEVAELATAADFFSDRAGVEARRFIAGELLI